MPDFPVEKNNKVELKRCGKPEIHRVPFSLAANSTDQLTKQVQDAVLAIYNAAPDALKDVAQTLATLFDNDSSEETIKKVVAALVATITHLKQVGTVVFCATNCCPPEDCEIVGTATLPTPRAGAIALEGTLDSYPPGMVESCPGGKGTQKVQFFTVTWVFSITLDQFGLFYPITLQVDMLEVRAPCCAAEEPPPPPPPVKKRRRD